MLKTRHNRLMQTSPTLAVALKKYLQEISIKKKPLSRTVTSSNMA